MAKPKLRIIPLGGLGEIGKNMTVIEYGQDAIVIDAGIMFPANDMHGIDYIIPDFQYLKSNTDLNILGFIYTHGHEDHIGAVNHIVEAFPKIPLYATKLTSALLQVKIKNGRKFNEFSISETPRIHIIQPRKVFKLGPFEIEPFRMTHSIPDCVGFAIQTPQGLIVHTGDYKFDNNPVSGEKPDYGMLADLGNRGVHVLLADSTNADKSGWTASETTIEPAFDKVFKQAKGRIMVATFASLMSRVQQVANVARKYGRKMALTGYTMREYVKLARELGYLDIPDNLLVDIGKIDTMDPKKLVLMVTGTQGEPTAVLGRLAVGRHRFLDIKPNDTIILSSHPIPGNEEMVYRTIDRLILRGANVIYEPIENVHVSGHARRDEMQLLLNLVKPKYLLPVHGEVRHLLAHRKLAIQNGIPEENVIISENGSVIEVDKYHVRKGERLPGGYVFVDGSGVGDVGRAVIKDREILARDGFLLVDVTVNTRTGDILNDPRIISRGFVYLRESDDLMDMVRDAIHDVMYDRTIKNRNRQDMLEDKIGKLLYNETRRRPMIFSIINEVTF